MIRRLIAAALLTSVSGCSMLMAGFGRRENIECKDYVWSALIDLAAAAVVGGIAYSEGGGTGGYVGAGVFVGSSLVGMTGAIVCDARHEAKTTAPIYYPQGSSEPPESLRLDPQDDGVRDATPEEMGIGSGAKPVSTELTIKPSDPEPRYQTGADGYSPPSRDWSSKPTQQPPPPAPPPLPTCQLSPRIDCPQKTHCVLTEENHGVCQPIP